MPSNCDFKIAAHLTASCETPSVGGLRNHGYIINFDDIDFDNVTYDNTNNNLVTALPLKTGKKAYAVYMPGKTPFTGTQKTMSEGTYRNDFDKTVSIVILDNGAVVSHSIIDQLANGKFVVILENKYQGADKKNTFEIYGLEQGLTASEMTDEKYSEDTEGGWLVTLVEEGAPRSGLFFLVAASEGKTAVETTRELLEGMVATS